MPKPKPLHQTLGRRPLQLVGHYICPACRNGDLTSMVLMDAFACSFCRHIFEANLDQQTLHVVDSSQPLGWRWLGHRWQPLHQQDGVAMILGLVGALLLVLPAGLIAGSAYVFPPLEGSPGASVPVVWATVTLAAHGVLVLWLVAERYQLPLYVTTRVWLRRWQERLLDSA
ncbi:hypothetical protein C7271_01155 [filamentous cyanobacterium CCP5]|nr:hypothetical protein C7271_01155 [filamentous cyanobacterium CCP5]